MPITILPVASALLRIEPGDFYRQLALKLRVGDELPLEEVVAHLESIGYERREPVEMVGEYSVRGGILDVFSPESPKPVRIDLFGDQVESIRRFDVESQRSVLKIEDCTLLPLTEYQKSRELLVELGELMRQADIPRPRPAAARRAVSRLGTRRAHAPAAQRLGVLAAGPAHRGVGRAGAGARRRPALLDPPGADRALARLRSRSGLLPLGGAGTPGRRRSADGAQGAGDRLGAEARQLPHPHTPSLTFHGNMQVAIAEARTLVEAGNRVAFFASSTGEVERVADILNEYGMPYQLGLEQFDSTPGLSGRTSLPGGRVASIYLIKGLIRHGTVFQDSKLVVFGSEDLFETSEMVARRPSSKSALATFSADLIELKPGDYVVHAEHGVAQYLGLREISQGEAQGDYMLLEYAGGAKLYVPLTRMDLVQRFRGAGEAKPALDRMGGATWTRTKTRIKAKMRDMADELLKLYASRKMAEGFRILAG